MSEGDGARTDRNLRTNRKQVFGDVEKGTECRVCGRNVTDGRMKTCSDYCNNLLSAVMGMLNWSTVRRRVIERDDHTCQNCGFDMSRERAARDHIQGIIDEKLGNRPESPPLTEIGENEDYDWDEHWEKMDAWNERRDELKERYGDPYERDGALEVDHITRIADGGHPFDPGNLQTLCSECHEDKTAEENSGRRTPSRSELNESLFNYVADGGDSSV